MLHRSTSTFQPSIAIPSAAKPFDTQRYLKRAYDIGIMLFPSIFSSGSRHFGLCAYPGYSFSDGNRRLATEFANAMRIAPDATDSVFDALCADFGVDPDDPNFNDKVNAICRARSEQRTDGDKRLIDLCKRAKIALEKDLAATNLRDELSEKMRGMKPKAPTYVAPSGATMLERYDSRTMKEDLAGGISEWSRSAAKAYRIRIANVVAHEKECARIKREIGLARAETVANRAVERSMAAVENVAGMPATTQLGLAFKAGVFFAWNKAGYGLADTTGELLAHSIADDARMLGTGGAKRRSPSALAH